MNERIKELVKQAGATINEGFDGNKDFVYSITMSPEECEKFAELIVRECANICDALQDIPATEPRHCAEDIRIHFGVHSA